MENNIKCLENFNEFALSEKYEFAYLRINNNNPMAFDIAKKQGFCKEYDAYEVVPIPHTYEGKNTEEFRIFICQYLFF